MAGTLMPSSITVLETTIPAGASLPEVPVVGFQRNGATMR